MTTIDTTRRTLIAGAGLATLAANLPGTAKAAAQTKPQKNQGTTSRLGVAIVGLGGYGRFALERLADARIARPAGIVTGHADAARDIAQRLGIPEDAIYGYEDYERIAEDSRIHALHLCLPVGLHAEHARRAFAAGKHVLCEKPLAGSVAEAMAMTQAASAAGRVLMPAYRAWFSGAMEEARRRIAEGTHGALVSIDAHKGFLMALPEGNWRFDPALSGGGCLTDIGIYSVQLQRWFGGGLPRRVMAQAYSAPDDPRYRQVESDIQWLAEFDGGVLATGSASWRYRLQNRARLGFTHAWLDLDPATPAIGERLRLGLDAPARIEELTLPLRDQVPRMYDAFAEACLGRTPVPVPVAEGIDDLRMMQAIREASVTGRPVELVRLAQSHDVR